MNSGSATPGVTPVAHSIRDPHFGAAGVSAFGAQIVSTTGLYEWYYTIGLRTSSQCLVAASFLVLLSGLFMAAGVIHAASPILASINHHLGGFLSTDIGWHAAQAIRAGMHSPTTCGQSRVRR